MDVFRLLVLTHYCEQLLLAIYEKCGGGKRLDKSAIKACAVILSVGWFEDNSLSLVPESLQLRAPILGETGD